LLAIGGGSTIDLAKAVSAATGLPVVSVPTTYAGAEWASNFGIRDNDRRMQGGGTGANLAGIVYDPDLSLGLPLEVTVGTAMNALAHCAEALYSLERGAETDREALAGAGLISRRLPDVIADGSDLAARAELLRGAMHAGAALAAGMGVAHATAQALGGRYGLSHGAMNAICLPAGMRFNAEVAADELARLGEAMDCADPIERASELAALSVPTRLRDHGVPEDELEAVAQAAAGRSAAKTNPRPVSAGDILELLRSVW
jgi:maleylacetate reductase